MFAAPSICGRHHRGTGWRRPGICGYGDRRQGIAAGRHEYGPVTPHGGRCDPASPGADGGGTAIFVYPDFSVILTYSKTGQSRIGSEIIGDFGAITINSISQYAGVVSYIKGEEKVIADVPKKEEIMKWEAKYFADYIEDREEYNSDYEEKIQLMIKAHKCMEIMRNNANIIFGG